MTALQIRVLTVKSGDPSESDTHGGNRELTLISSATKLSGMHVHTCHPYR